MQKHVFFDLDSTLVTIEGLDYLAELKGLANEIVPITNAAMNGEIAMQIAMDRKIQLLKPSRAEICQIGQVYLNNFTRGAKEVITSLQALGYHCWILTGNFAEATQIVAEELSIPKTRVIANQLQYNDKGDFLAFDITQNPLAGNNGKTISLRNLGIDLKQVIVVGDGNTDLETQDYVGLFIGFGGVVKRQRVAEKSKVYVEDPDLRGVIPHILNFQKSKAIKNKLQYKEIYESIK